MNLKQLKALRAVMVTGSVSEASRSLFRTQPTVSALIAGLEDEIGYPLTARSHENYCLNRSALVFRKFRPAVELVESIMTPAFRPVSRLAGDFIAELRAELESVAEFYAQPRNETEAQIAN